MEDDENKIDYYNPYDVEMNDPRQFLVRNFENLVENQQWILTPAKDNKGQVVHTDKRDTEAYFHI